MLSRTPPRHGLGLAQGGSSISTRPPRDRVGLARRLRLRLLDLAQLVDSGHGVEVWSISTRVTRDRVGSRSRVVSDSVSSISSARPGLLDKVGQYRVRCTRYRVHLASAFCSVLETHFPESSFVRLTHMTMRWKALSEGYNSHEDIKA